MESGLLLHLHLLHYNVGVLGHVVSKLLIVAEGAVWCHAHVRVALRHLASLCLAAELVVLRVTTDHLSRLSFLLNRRSLRLGEHVGLLHSCGAFRSFSIHQGACQSVRRLATTVQDCGSVVVRWAIVAYRRMLLLVDLREGNQF